MSEFESFSENPDNWNSYSFPIDLDKVFSSQEKAIDYLSRLLMSSDFGEITQEEYWVGQQIPHLYDNIIVFCDKWQIPFNEELHRGLVTNLQTYRPDWQNSNWGC